MAASKSFKDSPYAQPIRLRPNPEQVRLTIGHQKVSRQQHSSPAANPLSAKSPNQSKTANTEAKSNYLLETLHTKVVSMTRQKYLMNVSDMEAEIVRRILEEKFSRELPKTRFVLSKHFVHSSLFNFIFYLARCSRNSILMERLSSKVIFETWTKNFQIH
jgi:hypothetical protein